MRSRSILPRVILAFGASGEKPLMHHKRESEAMLSAIFADKQPSIATPPRKTPGWLKRSCAVLLSATMMVPLAGPASTPATAQQPARQPAQQPAAAQQPTQKPNIIFIMGDD